MGGIKGGFGSFLLRRASSKSIRQRYATGPQFNKRKTFHFPKGYHQLHLRVAPALVTNSPTHQIEYERYRHLPGDARTRPVEDYTFSHYGPNGEGRADRAMYAWRKRGRLQLHQMGGVRETFVCYRCGYPVKSALVAICDDNWDYRMCYNCYTKTIHSGMENNT